MKDDVRAKLADALAKGEHAMVLTLDTEGRPDRMLWTDAPGNNPLFWIGLLEMAKQRLIDFHTVVRKPDAPAAPLAQGQAVKQDLSK